MWQFQKTYRVKRTVDRHIEFLLEYAIRKAANEYWDQVAQSLGLCEDVHQEVVYAPVWRKRLQMEEDEYLLNIPAADMFEKAYNKEVF